VNQGEAAGAEDGPAPPAGFVLATGRGPFSQHNGPFYVRSVPDGAEHGFFALERHCNGLGVVHGGMLASFLDGLLGHAVSAAARSTAVTIHLSLDYLSMARAGEWVEGRARITRQTREVVFAEATALVGARSVVRASAIFKIMDRHRALG
jgi:uncharacterized protein (TIGR00369 family)